MSGLRGKRAATQQRFPKVKELTPEHLVAGALNLVIFGPGRGEAILVGLPDGSYGVVDGCREREDPMLAFLRALEARAQSPLSLRFVCLTHPHDDHYAGLGALLQAFKGRVEQVWKPHEAGDRFGNAYIQYMELMSRADEEVPDPDVLKRLERVFWEMRREHSPGKPDARTVERGMVLFEQRMNRSKVRIRAVAPSRRDVDLAQDALINALRNDRTDVTRRGHYEPNRASGALLIQWGKAKALLTGDLLTGGEEPSCGWNRAAAEIDGPVQVVKVAHHGSAGAHHGELWTKMAPQLAIVTPFKDAVGSQPPRPEDIQRLSSSDARVVITSPPAWHIKTNRPRAKNRALALSTPPERRVSATRNAVAVALGSDGTITQCILAGEAAEH